MRLFLVLVFFINFVSCSENAVKRHYLQAEKLWSEEHYQASIKEYEIILRSESQGEEEDPLVTQALYRAGMTQTLYLSQHEEALQKFEAFLKRNITKEQRKNVLLEMGEVLFTRIKNYERSFNHFKNIDRSLLSAEEHQFVQMRQARCMLFLWRFEEALELLNALKTEAMKNTMNEQVYIELGNVYLTYAQSQQNTDKKAIDLNNKAIQVFEEYISKHSKGEQISEAYVGLAMSYEQLDQLDKALEKLEEAEKLISNNRLITIKKDRLKERIVRRKR